MTSSFSGKSRFCVKLVAFITVCIFSATSVGARHALPLQPPYLAFSPTVYLIQDAHDSLDAQESIRSILKDLVEKEKVSMVCFEGGSLELDRGFYNFTRDAKKNEAIWDQLAKEGEISGLERYALEAPRSVRFYGIEEEELYFQNLDAIRKVYEEEAKNQTSIRDIEAKFAKERGRYLTGDLKKLIDLRRALDEKRLDLRVYGRELTKWAQKVLKLDLTDPRNQDAWPQMVRLVKLGEMKVKGQDPISFPYLKGHLRWYFERLVDEGIELDKDWVGFQVLQDELEAGPLFDEIERLEKQILDGLQISKEAREFLARDRAWQLTKKLMKLELTRREWEEVVGARHALPLQIEAAKNNYRLVTARDRILTEKTKDRLAKLGGGKAAVVVGGFHTSEFEKFLKAQGINYTVVNPTIRDLNRKLDYRARVTAASHDQTAPPAWSAISRFRATPHQRALARRAARLARTGTATVNGGSLGQVPESNLDEFLASDFQGPVIIGGTGFVGSNLAESLAKEGTRVAALFRSRQSEKFANLERVSASLSAEGKEKNLILLEAGNVLDPVNWAQDPGSVALLKKILSKATVIYHLAAQPNVRPREGQSYRDFAVETLVADLFFTKVIARLAGELGKPVIYGSSAAVFTLNPLFARPIEEPVTEETGIPFQPETRQFMSAANAAFNQYVTSFLREGAGQSPREFTGRFLADTVIPSHSGFSKPLNLFELLTQVETLQELKKERPAEAAQFLERFKAEYPADLAFGFYAISKIIPGKDILALPPGKGAVLRFVNGYGPGMRPEVLHIFVTRLLASGPVGFSGHVRDFIEIQDSVDVMRLMAAKMLRGEIRSNKILHVASGTGPLSMRELLEITARVLGIDLSKLPAGTVKTIQDIPDLRLPFMSIEKLRGILGWIPRISLEKGIPRLAAFVRGASLGHGLKAEGDSPRTTGSPGLRMVGAGLVPAREGLPQGQPLQKAGASGSSLGEIGLLVVPDRNVMAREVAEGLADVVRKKPNAVLGLATGGTIEGVYSELVKIFKADPLLNFSQVTTFNLDEYLGLGPGHPQSYRYFMETQLFELLRNHAPERAFKRGNTHVFDGLAKDPEKELERFLALIEEKGGIDWQVLGIGRVGHIAFHEPAAVVTPEFMKELDAPGVFKKVRDLNEFVIDDRISDEELPGILARILAARRLARSQLGDYKDLLDSIYDPSNDTSVFKKGTPLADKTEDFKRQLNELGAKLLQTQETTFYLSDKHLQSLSLSEGEGRVRVKFKPKSEFFASPAKIVSLAIPTILDNSRFFERLTDVPEKALTQTGVVLRAREIVLAATGAGKRNAVREALTGPVTSKLPASILQEHPNALFIVDQEAWGASLGVKTNEEHEADLARIREYFAGRTDTPRNFIEEVLETEMDRSKLLPILEGRILRARSERISLRTIAREIKIWPMRVAQLERKLAGDILRHIAFEHLCTMARPGRKEELLASSVAALGLRDSLVSRLDLFSQREFGTDRMTIGQLVHGVSREDILAKRGFGPKTLAIIEERLKQLGLAIGQSLGAPNFRDRYGNSMRAVLVVVAASGNIIGLDLKFFPKVFEKILAGLSLPDAVRLLAPSLVITGPVSPRALLLQIKEHKTIITYYENEKFKKEFERQAQALVAKGEVLAEELDKYGYFAYLPRLRLTQAEFIRQVLRNRKIQFDRVGRRSLGRIATEAGIKNFLSSVVWNGTEALIREVMAKPPIALGRPLQIDGSGDVKGASREPIDILLMNLASLLSQDPDSLEKKGWIRWEDGRYVPTDLFSSFLDKALREHRLETINSSMA